MLLNTPGVGVILEGIISVFCCRLFSGTSIFLDIKLSPLTVTAPSLLLSFNVGSMLLNT